MIDLGTDSNARSVRAYASEVYVNTESQVARLKLVKIWLNSDGSEFKRASKSVVFDNSTIHHEDEDESVGIFDYWMGQTVSGPMYSAISGLVEQIIVASGYLEDM